MQQLGVAYIVEGTVRREGNDVRITAKLINGADGLQVWASGNLNREVRKVLAVQEEIAGLIAKELSLKLGASSPAATAAVHPEAFRLYLEGREAWAERIGRGSASQERSRAAEALFEKSIALDPGFARAHASLAEVRANRYASARSRSYEEATAIAAKVREATERALAIDPNLAEAYTARARILWADRQFDAAAGVFQQAIALNPNYANARSWYCITLFAQGKLAEGLTQAELASRLEPASPTTANILAGHLAHARRWREALVAADRLLAMRPNSSQTQDVRLRALIGLGRFTEARAVEQNISDDDLSPPERIVRLAQMGEREKAGELAETVLVGLTSERFVDVVFAAYVALGRVDDGFAFLEKLNARFTREPVAWYIAPVFDGMRDDPRFKKKLGQSGRLAAYNEAWSQYLAWKQRTGEP